MGATNKGGRVTTLPGRHVAAVHVEGALITVDSEQVAFFNNSGKSIRVKKTSFVPDVAVTGAATNHFTLGVVNRGTDGLGTTDVSPAKAYDNGIDIVQFDEDDIPVSTTEADTEVADGAVVSFDNVQIGTGLAVPAGLFYMEYEFI